MDHKIPVSKKGSHALSNLALSHKKCNAEKLNKTLEEHWAWRHAAGLDATKITQHYLDNSLVAASCREE